MDKAEIVIVGAGPSGSTAALLLARRGWDVLLVDQARFPRDKPCGEYLNPAATAALHRLGLLGALSSGGARTVVGAYLTSPAGREVRVPFPSTVDEPRPTGLSVPRLALDATLLRAAHAAGASLREGFRVDDLLRSRLGVTGVIGHDRTSSREIHARLVIGADGSRSIIARRLGMMREPAAPRRFGLVAHYEGVEGEDWIEMHAGARGYCGLGFSSPDGANVAMVAEPSDLPRLAGRAEAFFEERLSEFPAVSRRIVGARRMGRVLVTGSMSSRAARLGAPGVLLVGDAAGFYDPFTGEGVSYALRGAELVAEAAEAALMPGTSGWSRKSARRRQCAAMACYGARRRVELGPRLAASRVIQAVLRRPRLLELIFERFQTNPSLAQRLIGVTAGILSPAELLSPAYLFELMAPLRWAPD